MILDYQHLSSEMRNYLMCMTGSSDGRSSSSVGRATCTEAAVAIETRRNLWPLKQAAAGVLLLQPMTGRQAGLHNARNRLMYHDIMYVYPFSDISDRSFGIRYSSGNI